MFRAPWMLLSTAPAISSTPATLQLPSGLTEAAAWTRNKGDNRHMRKIALILSIFAFAAMLATPQPTSVLLDAAYKTAKAENKKVFVTFHASWCGWCKKMEAFMDMPEFKKIFEDNYVIVPVTVLESKV